MSKSITVHEQYAKQYDELVIQSGWFGNEVIYGMMYEYLQKNKKLLDLGIGTGMGAEYFVNAGIEVHGVDGSEAMLEQCSKRKSIKDLKIWDFNNIPFPYKDLSFDYLVSKGVVHFFDDLTNFFSECARIIKPKGVFGFTTEGLFGYYSSEKIHNAEKYLTRESFGIPVYSYNPKYIEEVIEESGFTLLKKTYFTNIESDPIGDSAMIGVFICRKS